jgi:hypothetical protein
MCEIRLCEIRPLSHTSCFQGRFVALSHTLCEIRALSHTLHVYVPVSPSHGCVALSSQGSVMIYVLKCCLKIMVPGLGFEFRVLGSGVRGLGSRVRGLGSGVWGLGFEVWNFGSQVSGFGF